MGGDCVLEERGDIVVNEGFRLEKVKRPGFVAGAFCFVDACLCALYTCVGEGGDFFEAGFEGVVYVEAFDVGGDCFAGDFLVCAGEGFEGFVWVGVSFFAEDCLDSFGYDGPVVFEVVVDGGAVEFEFGEAFHE